MDFKVDSDGDIVIENGDFVFVTGIAAVAQDIQCELRRWFNEDAYDRAGGVPYREVIFQPSTSVQSILFILEEKIRARDGVTDVLSLNATVDRAARTIAITGRVRALDQEFPIEVTTA